MTALDPLPSFIRASAQDAANMQMRAAGRVKWNEDDWNRMVEVQERLIHSCYGKASDHNQPEMCFLRFQMAERMEKAGQLRGLKGRAIADALEAVMA